MKASGRSTWSVSAAEANQAGVARLKQRGPREAALPARSLLPAVPYRPREAALPAQSPPPALPYTDPCHRRRPAPRSSTTSWAATRTKRRLRWARRWPTTSRCASARDATMVLVGPQSARCGVGWEEGPLAHNMWGRCRHSALHCCGGVSVSWMCCSLGRR